jgi:hypothetical protein
VLAAGARDEGSGAAALGRRARAGGDAGKQCAQLRFVGVGNPAWRATHAQNISASGWDSSLSPDCPQEKRDWADQRALQISKQREGGISKGKRKQEWPSEFSYGPKQVRVRAERENGLTVLVEHDRVIREREKEKGEIRPTRW